MATSKLAKNSCSHVFIFNFPLSSFGSYAVNGSQFLMPGLVDTHLHAPQYVNSGIGYDKKLLDWLDVYTFPTEARCSDVDYARNVYTKAVVRVFLSGAQVETNIKCYQHVSLASLLSNSYMFGTSIEDLILVRNICQNRF